MRRVLIATDGSDHALKSVQYVANVYGRTPDLQVTLLHVYPTVPSIFLEEGHDPLIKKDLMEWYSAREEEAERYINDASQVFQNAGLDKSRIIARHRPKEVGIARDIVSEAERGGDDAIVFGKKGLSRFEEFFLGSITNKLLELGVKQPLWVVDGHVASRKVLIAMDETAGAIDLARYAGKMLGGLEGVQFLLYHCCTPFSEILMDENSEGLGVLVKRHVEIKKRKISQIFKESERAFVESGIDQGAIETRFYFDPSLTDKSVSKNILSEVERENFGTLVMGRKGSTDAREFSMGSVSRRTLSEAKNCAVWII